MSPDELSSNPDPLLPVVIIGQCRIAAQKRGKCANEFFDSVAQCVALAAAGSSFSNAVSSGRRLNYDALGDMMRGLEGGPKLYAGFVYQVDDFDKFCDCPASPTDTTKGFVASYVLELYGNQETKSIPCESPKFIPCKSSVRIATATKRPRPAESGDGGSESRGRGRRHRRMDEGDRT